MKMALIKHFLVRISYEFQEFPLHFFRDACRSTARVLLMYVYRAAGGHVDFLSTGLF